MTNQEIVEYQRRQKALRESAQTIAARLRAAASGEAETTIGLVIEAADAIDYLHAQIARMNREAREEEREIRNAVQDAYAEGRHEGREEARGGW